MPPTAILGQEGDQPASALDVDRVVNAPLDAPGTQQARSLEVCEVMRQGGRRQPDPPGDPARRQAAGPLLDEKAKDFQPVLLSKRGESSNGSAVFRILTKWVSTTIRRARIGSRMACQADERNLSELPRSKAEIQGWFAGIALARSRIDAALWRSARPLRRQLDTCDRQPSPRPACPDFRVQNGPLAAITSVRPLKLNGMPSSSTRNAK